MFLLQATAVDRSPVDQWLYRTSEMRHVEEKAAARNLDCNMFLSSNRDQKQRQVCHLVVIKWTCRDTKTWRGQPKHWGVDEHRLKGDEQETQKHHRWSLHIILEAFSVPRVVTLQPYSNMTFIFTSAHSTVNSLCTQSAGILVHALKIKNWSITWTEVLSAQTLTCLFSCAHWSSVRYFYNTPGVHLSADWLLFGKAHTCLYKLP